MFKNRSCFLTVYLVFKQIFLDIHILPQKIDIDGVEWIGMYGETALLGNHPVANADTDFWEHRQTNYGPPIL